MKMNRETKIAVAINALFVVFVIVFVALAAVGCTHTFIDLGEECESDMDCADGDPCTVDICGVDHACVQVPSDDPACEPPPDCVPTDEVCNGADDDCDGLTDEGLENIGPCGLPSVGECADGHLMCLDGASNICVNAVLPIDEVCDDGLDNDCDGETDEGCGECATETRYRDEDGDGYGDPEFSAIVCIDAPPSDGVRVARDCNDSDAAIHPGAWEVCDSVDNDCDGNTDEGLLIPYYIDRDGDGYGDPGWLVGYICYGSALSNWAPNRGDCDDSDPTVHPGAGCPPCEITYYQDFDGDGYGNPASGRVFSCDDSSVVGYVPTIGDCDDRFSSIHAGASEVCDDLDDDCDTTVDEGCP